LLNYLILVTWSIVIIFVITILPIREPHFVLVSPRILPLKIVENCHLMALEAPYWSKQFSENKK